MIKLSELEQKRKDILDSFAKKQAFRVAIGTSAWINYEIFTPAYNLREILNDEVVIEFDTDRAVSLIATEKTKLNLHNAGYTFEIWDHNGRSPHIHIHNLPIANLDPKKKSTFKKLFIKKYVPLEYQIFVDSSLTGIHLIRLEYSPCWKGKYGIKELIYISNSKKEGNSLK